MEALFTKLLAYKHELSQQPQVDVIDMKKKGITLMASSSKESQKEESSNKEDAENLNLIVKKFEKFPMRKKDKKFFKP